ncbi:MAG: replication-associated recombination protein A, partial [Patescibacteria group bacterium]
LWGPPGTGKTTLAHIIAKITKSAFHEISATSSGLEDLRKIFKSAAELLQFNSQKTVLFIDEIHRWNKAQQDALLPFVERGIIILIGATTENPSFEVNGALLSRSRVFVLKMLAPEDIKLIICRALVDKERGLGNLDIKLEEEAANFLANVASGDARKALGALEIAVKLKQKLDGQILIDKNLISEALQNKSLLYDRAGEEHYNIISALHKSMRGSDANAAIYWLGRMLEGGEDPLYVARRLIRFAAEDVGMADPRALIQAVAAYQAAHFIGMPECNGVLAETVAYLAKAPKSNKIYEAYQKVQEDIQNLPNEPVPFHIRNAPTKLMKGLGYGKDYKYSPEYDYQENQDYLPEKLKGRKYI